MSGLTLAKLKAAKRILDRAPVPMSGRSMIMVGGKFIPAKLPIRLKKRPIK